MKIFAFSMPSIGHIHPVVGLCQALQERGHEIHFALSEAFENQMKKFPFEWIFLPNGNSSEKSPNDEAVNPIKEVCKKLKKIGLLSNKPALEKLKSETEEQRQLWIHMMQDALDIEPRIKKEIERIQPDLIVVDLFMGVPSIINGSRPWVSIWSGNPLMLFNSPKLPPFGSGLPTNDRSRWAEFDNIKTSWFVVIEELQNKLLEHFGYPPIERKYLALVSPHLNIYNYPAELDYTDIATPPSTYLQVDDLCRKVPNTFQLPEEFKSKIKLGDKLIYVSMGSMGSFDVDLMKKIVNALKDTPHKYIVSKGQLGDEYELPDNMWGENFLPQTNILPLVDLVITHGGNNSATETFICGKPMIVMPFFGDQFDNAQRVAEKGYGVRLTQYDFEDSELVEAVDRLLADQALKVRLQQAAHRIQQSNSKQKACIALEKLAAQHKN